MKIKKNHSSSAGQKGMAILKSTFVTNPIFMKSRTYFFWTLFGVCAVLTSFTLSRNESVRHLVVLKYKPTTSAAQQMEVTNAFRELKNKIPGILAFEHGTNVSAEKKDLGFNYVYLMTFKDIAARDAYLPHPEHKKFGELLSKLGVVEDVFVTDFKNGK